MLTNKTNFKSIKTFKLFLLLIIQYSLFISDCYSQFWIQQSSGITETIRSIDFANANTGWFVSYFGVIKKTTNGGINWFSQNSNTTLAIYSVHCLDTNFVYACGDGNTVLYTSNGGNNWNKYTGGSGAANCIFFTNQNTGFYSSTNSQGNNSIFKSISGGSSWASVYIAGTGTSAFYSIYFVNNLTGWCGAYDRLVKTTDGGTTWTLYNHSGNKYGLYFINETTGWMAGSDLKRTTDGGVTWTTVLSGTFRSVTFVNSNIGYTVGYSGVIYKTTDGNTWTAQNSGVSVDLYSVSFANANTGWASGGYGTIIKTTTGGVAFGHDISIGPYLNLPTIVSIQNPVTVNTLVSNIGMYNESSVPVKFFVNNILVNTTNKNLGIGQIDTVSNVWTPSDTGVYNLMYVATAPIDTNRLNDTVRAQVNVFGNFSNACIGTGTNSFNSPFATGAHDSRIQMLFTSSELLSAGLGANKSILKIGFNVISNSSQVMNGFNVRFQHTSLTTLSDFVTAGWSSGYSGTYQVQGTGWQYINLLSPFFLYNGTDNLLVEICFDNTNYTVHSPVYSTSMSGRACFKFANTESGCTMTNPVINAPRPNICFTTSSLTNSNNYINTLPEKFTLSQNYPNPFNPVTRINYDIPKQGFVSLKVYDVIGREVKSLVNETKSAGSYSVDFNGSELTSGVYFYRLTVHQGGSSTGDFTETKRMMLIK